MIRVSKLVNSSHLVQEEDGGHRCEDEGENRGDDCDDGPGSEKRKVMVNIIISRVLLLLKIFQFFAVMLLTSARSMV